MILSPATLANLTLAPNASILEPGHGRVAVADIAADGARLRVCGVEAGAPFRKVL